MKIRKSERERKTGARQKGFTLIELFVTVAMAAMLLVVGVPSFRTMSQNNRLTADTNRFLTSMMLARSDAVKRGATTTMTAKGGSWLNGWTVQGAVLLRDEEALNPSLTLTGGSVTYQYDADGTLNIGGPETLDVCDSTQAGETGRRITVTPIGHAVVNSTFVCP